MTGIDRIKLYRLSLPLTVPYKLVFGPVTAFDTVIAEVYGDDGGTGIGEATILTGYTPETIDGCWQAMCKLATRVKGLPVDEAKAALLADHHDTPFSVTALITAVEMMEGHPVLVSKAASDVPLLAILSATDEAGIAAEIARHTEAGYTTIKVKIGWDAADDLARVTFIQSCLPDGVRIRLDGNQGFSKADGMTFARSVRPDSIELLEQPCHMDDWDAAAAVSEVSTVPFMLDESIYGEAEIERAAEMGTVQYIKLKLMKAGSLDNLMRQLRLISERGMKPVLGNGVAADPGCWMEACVARSLIDNAGEMNGFLKPREPIFVEPMPVAGGAVRLPETEPALIDLSSVALDTFDVESR